MGIGKRKEKKRDKKRLERSSSGEQEDIKLKKKRTILHKTSRTVYLVIQTHTHTV